MNLVSRYSAYLGVFLFSFFIYYSLIASGNAFAAELIGWAEMPIHSFSIGPTTKQFQGGDIEKNRQVLQGLSSVSKGLEPNIYYFLVDNGYGKKNNSADALLRLYEVKIDFSTKENKSNSVEPIKYLSLNDAGHMVKFDIQADYLHYYDEESNPAVDEGIRKKRLLTGADFDPESLQVDNDGNFWIGDEFGPFLLHIEASSGSLLHIPISLDGIVSPENPYVNKKKYTPNLPSSGGFEAMAINPERNKLYPMLEAAVEGEAERVLRMYTFDINARAYAQTYYQYRLDDQALSVRDMVALSETQFLILETNLETKPSKGAFKRVFLVDTRKVDANQVLIKKEIVDLVNLRDPYDLDSDGKDVYAFSYVTIESLHVIDKNTLFLSNDNNYSEPNYFIKVKLDEELPATKVKPVKIDATHWENQKSLLGLIDLSDHSFFGWMTVLAYFFTSIRSGVKAKIAKDLLSKDFIFWVLLSALLIFLGLNKQLDLQSYFTDVLRDMAKTHGWYEERRKLQVLFIAFLGLMVPFAFLLLRVTLVDLWRRYRVIFIGLILLSVFVVIRAASFHHVDLVFYKNIGAIRFYQLLELLAIGVIFLGTFTKLRSGRMFEGIANDEKVNAGIEQRYVEVNQEGADVACPSCQFPALSKAVDGRVFKCKSCKLKYRVYVVN